MCKGCQYCIESCYWHLVEKHFCYDESIALYEEPVKMVKHQNSFDNMAFYDQVALIAGRAIVTIDPLPNKPKPIEHQPVRRIRWWEDNVDEQNKENEAKNKQTRQNSPIPTITEAREDLTSSMEELDSIIRQKVSIIAVDSKEENKEPNSENSSNKIINQNSPTRNEEDKPADSINSVSTAQKASSLLLAVTEPSKNRKKSLRERRMSRSLTLNIDRHLELPVIRQISMPKFYIDTPEANQLDASILMAPSTTLTSPVMPRSSLNDFFDLRSVVQLEKEHRAHGQHHPVPVHKQLSPHSRLSQIKEKLKSTKLKRQGSATNLPNSIQHI